MVAYNCITFERRMLRDNGPIIYIFFNLKKIYIYLSLFKLKERKKEGKKINNISYKDISIVEHYHQVRHLTVSYPIMGHQMGPSRNLSNLLFVSLVL